MEKKEKNVKEPIVEIESDGVKNEDDKIVSKGFQNVNNNFYGKEKKTWPFVLLGVLILLVGVGCFYYFIYTSPKNIMKKAFNDAVSKVQESSKKLNDTKVDTVTVSSDIILKSESESLKDANGMNAKLVIGTDNRDKNKNYISMDVTKEEEKIFEMIASYIDEKLYLDLKDKFSKVIYMENSSTVHIDGGKINAYLKTTNTAKTSEEIEYLISNIKSSILNNMSSDKLSKKILLKEVEGKKIPAVDVKYTISNSELRKILAAVYDGLVNDSKALEILSSLTETKVADVKNELLDAKGDLADIEMPVPIILTVTVNAITREFIQLEGNVSLLTFKIVDTDSTFKFEVSAMGMIYVKANADKKENKFYAEAGFMNSFKASLTMKNEVADNKPSKTNMSIVIYDPEDTNKEMTTITANFVYEYNKEVKPIDIEGAVNYEELTEEEQEKVEEILSTLSKLFPKSESSLFEDNDEPFDIEFEED